MADWHPPPVVTFKQPVSKGVRQMVPEGTVCVIGKGGFAGRPLEFRQGGPEDRHSRNQPVGKNRSMQPGPVCFRDKNRKGQPMVAGDGADADRNGGIDGFQALLPEGVTHPGTWEVDPSRHEHPRWVLRREVFPEEHRKGP